MSRNYAGVARLELFLFKSGSAFPGRRSRVRQGEALARRDVAPPNLNGVSGGRGSRPGRLPSRQLLLGGAYTPSPLALRGEDRPALGQRERGTGGVGRAGSGLLALGVWRNGHRQVLNRRALKRWALKRWALNRWALNRQVLKSWALSGRQAGARLIECDPVVPSRSALPIGRSGS